MLFTSSLRSPDGSAQILHAVRLRIVPRHRRRRGRTPVVGAPEAAYSHPIGQTARGAVEGAGGYGVRHFEGERGFAGPCELLVATGVNPG